MGKDLLGLEHATAEEIEGILVTEAMKESARQDIKRYQLSGQVNGLPFYEPSTRRTSFELAGKYLIWIR